MTNRSLIFSSHLDSAPFKDFVVDVEVIAQHLQNEPLWLNRNELFPVEQYEIEKLNFVKGKLIGVYGVFSIIDDNTVELKNNSTVPILFGTLKKHGLKRHQLLEVEYTYETKEISILNVLKPSEVDNRRILKTSADIVMFRDELVYYMLQTPKEYQDVMVEVLQPVWVPFKDAPGSVVGHHVSLGGLLEHTVEDIRIAKTIFELNDYEQSNLLGSIYTLSAAVHWEELCKQRRGEFTESAMNYMVKDFHEIANTYLGLEGDILFEDIVLSFILHDLGKTVEASYLNDSRDKYVPLGMGNIVNVQQDGTTFFERDTIGGQFGHVVLSMIMFNNLNNMKDLGLDLVLINRVIATHHGIVSFGSIQPAESKFEYLINISDKIGALFCAENKRLDIRYE